MDLLDRYLQAVRFWLPKAQQDDILAELSEDLQSQIDDKQNEVGHPISDEEVSAILKRCGSPILVASRYRPQSYLIGPALFPIYLFVLKMVLLFVLVPVFLFIVGPMNVVNSREWPLALVKTMGDLWSGAFTATGTITLIFVILERTQALLGILEKWDPRSLPAVQKKERKPSVVHSVCDLAFAVLGVIWLLLVPHYPVLILGPAAAILKASPVWHPFYIPLLLLAIAGFLRAAISLAKPEWEWFPFVSQLFNTAFALILVKLIIAATGVPAGGIARPLVILADSVHASPQYAHIVVVVNASILIGLAGTWIGLCIGLVVHTWEFMRSHCRRRASARSPAQFLLA